MAELHSVFYDSRAVATHYLLQKLLVQLLFLIQRKIQTKSGFQLCTNGCKQLYSHAFSSTTEWSGKGGLQIELLETSGYQDDGSSPHQEAQITTWFSSRVQFKRTKHLGSKSAIPIIPFSQLCCSQVKETKYFYDKYRLTKKLCQFPFQL